MVGYACKDLAGVSESLVEMNSGIQFMTVLIQMIYNKF